MTPVCSISLPAKAIARLLVTVTLLQHCSSSQDGRRLCSYMHSLQTFLHMQVEKRQQRLQSLVALHLLLLLLPAANSSCMHFGSDSSICPTDAAKCATVYMGNSRLVLLMV